MRVCVAILLSSMFVSASADAQLAKRATRAPSPATLEYSRQFDVRSAITGRTYRVRVALPFPSKELPVPKGGYPILYVLDGNWLFEGFAGAGRWLPQMRETESAIIVGVGYPEPDIETTRQRRVYDLTPGAPSDRALMPPEVAFGGAEGFLKVIKTEIEPRVAELAPVDRARSILFGDSFGGLFVVYTLLTHPESFATYVALSPSLWWDIAALQRARNSFELRMGDHNLAPRVFIGVGGLEQDPPPPPYPPGETRESMAAKQEKVAMIDNAEALATHLGAIKGPEGYRVEYRLFAGQNHGNVWLASIEAMLDFSLPLPLSQSPPGEPSPGQQSIPLSPPK